MSGVSGWEEDEKDVWRVCGASFYRRDEFSLGRINQESGLVPPRSLARSPSCLIYRTGLASASVMPRTLPRRELGSTVSSQFNNQNWPTNTAAVCRTTPDHSTFLVDYQSHIISHHSSLTLPLSYLGRMSLSSSQSHNLTSSETMNPCTCS